MGGTIIHLDKEKTLKFIKTNPKLKTIIYIPHQTIAGESLVSVTSVERRLEMTPEKILDALVEYAGA